MIRGKIDPEPTVVVNISDVGPKGEQGEQGPKGDKGEQGEQGPKGDKGDKGDTGEVSMAQLNEVRDSVDNLQAFVGYTDDDIMGVEVDFKNNKFTRLAGAVNRTPGAMFDDVQAFGGRKRCILTDDGVVLAYHGEPGWTETGKLTQAVTIGEDEDAITYPVGTLVQVMVEQPKFYYKVVPLTVEPIANGKGYHMRKGRYYISDYPKAGFKVHPAFVRNGVERDKIYLSAYEGSIYDNSASSYLLNDEQVADFSTDKLSSVANAKPCSGLAQNLTRANARLLAHNRGIGWEQQTIQTVSLTQLLFLIEYNMFNMQTAIGMGAVRKRDDGSTNTAENTGGTTTLGNATGAVTNTNGIQIVSYRGEENPYGNIRKWIDGINIYNYGEGSVYIADHTFADSKKDGAYQDAEITIAGRNGYVSAFAYSENFDWLFIASEVSGNSSLPVGDYFYQNKASSQYTVAELGGAWGNGASAGGFCCSVGHAVSGRYRTVGGRLLYAPDAA